MNILQAFSRKSFYSWIDRTQNQADPGAEAFAFNSLMLPLYEWKGPGDVVYRQAMLTAPQVYQVQMVVPTGIAGIAAGQIAPATLTDNPSQDGVNG